MVLAPLVGVVTAVLGQDTQIVGEYQGSSEWPNGALVLSICPIKQSDWDSLPASIPRRSGGGRCVDVATTTTAVDASGLRLRNGPGKASVIRATVYPCTTELRRSQADPLVGLCVVALATEKAPGSDQTLESYNSVRKRIAGFEKTHERIALANKTIDDVVTLADGSNADLIYVTPGQYGNVYGVIVGHPDAPDLIDFPGGVSGEVNGMYFGYAWVMEVIPEAILVRGMGKRAAILADHAPKELVALYAERTRLSRDLEGAGVNPATGNSVASERATRESALASAKAAKDEEKSKAEKTTRSGTVFRCVTGDRVATLLIKSDPSFEVVYRPKDFPVILGWTGPDLCDLKGSEVTITSFACDLPSPCVGSIEVRK